MLKQKIPAYYLFIALFSVGALSYFFFQNAYRKSENNILSGPSAISEGKLCDYTFERLAGYKHIKPLVWVRPICESEKYSGLKAQLTAVIQSYMSAGILRSASYDLRDLKEGDWISFNDDEQYSPGSLMKVQVMITILRMSEDQPGLLDHEILFDKPFQRVIVPRFPDVTIQLGHKYTMRELLQRLIRYSDNDANDLLLKNIDTVILKKTFSDFGFPEVQRGKPYPITARQFSTYMEMLYNAGYLTIKNSEYATNLLCLCHFKQGMTMGLPDTILVAHKFGESEDSDTQEFHESGIIYNGDSPYLLTIMTKGPDIMKLPEVVSVMSKVIYDYKNKPMVRSGITSK